MNLLVRADSSPTVGTGHVMRCLALGQACVDRGGAVFFATPDAESLLFARLGEAEAVEVLPLSPAGAGVTIGGDADADATAGAARSRRADWVALDGYRFDDDYQRRIKQDGLRLLVLDDFGHAASRPADVLLNQNLHAEAAHYEPDRDPRSLLLGPRYALLRREFAGWRERSREIPDRATKILVTLGGGDTGGAVVKVLSSLIALGRSELSVRCLLGPLAVEAPEIERLTDGAGFEISFETAAAEMPELMAWADLAVSGGGSTCWELAFMGLPALTLAHNAHQERIALSVEEAGAALHAGSAGSIRGRELTTLLAELLDNAELREKMSTRGRELVDGRGAERVLRELERRLAGEDS